MVLNIIKKILIVVGLVGFTSPVLAQDKCNPNEADTGYHLIWKLNSLDSLMDVVCKLEESGLEYGGDFSQSFGETPRIVPKHNLFGELAGLPYFAGGSRFLLKVSRLPIGQISCDAEMEIWTGHSQDQMYLLAALVAQGRSSSALLPTEQGDQVLGGFIKEIKLKCGVDDKRFIDNLVADFNAAAPNTLTMSPNGIAVYSYERSDGLFSAEYYPIFGDMTITPDTFMHPVGFDSMMKVAEQGFEEKDYELNNLEQRKLN